MSKRCWRKPASLLCALVLTNAELGCFGSEGPEPNVLMITIDTLQADRLGAYGFRLEGIAPIASAAIDRLANDTAKSIWIDGLLEQHILQALEHAAFDDVVLVVVKRGHHQNR